MDEEVIVPFGCSPQVCLESVILSQMSEEFRDSSTYQRYLGIKEEVLTIQERVNKAVQDFEQFDSGKDELKKVQEDIQEHLGEIIQRYDQTQAFRDNVFEQFQEFCDSEGQLSSNFEDEVYETAETLQKVVNGTDMTRMVGYYRRELADLGDIHDALLKLLFASIRDEKDSVEKFKKAYKDAFGEKDTRYERLMDMYTEEAMMQQKSSREQKSLGEMVEEMKLINGHLLQLREEDKLKLATLAADLDSKNSRILSLQQSLAKLTAESRNTSRTRKGSASPAVVDGGPKRKVSTNLPPIGSASGGRQRKISQNALPPPVPLEGDGQSGEVSENLIPPISSAKGGEEKSGKEEVESKLDKKKFKGKDRPARNVDSANVLRTRKVSVKHVARQLEKHLDDLEDVVAAREQRMTAISRLTQRKAELVKTSLKGQHARILQSVQKNIAFIANSLPADINVEPLEALVESLSSDGDVLKVLNRRSGEPLSVVEDFLHKLEEVYSDIVNKSREMVSQGRGTMGSKTTKACNSALKAMQEAVKPLQRQMAQEVSQLRGHVSQVNKRKAEISKALQSQKSQSLQQVEKLLGKLDTQGDLQDKDRLQQLKEIAGRLVTVQVANLEPKELKKDLESFRKGASEFFKREAGFQKAYQITSPRPGPVVTSRRGVGSGHGEVNHHKQQEPQSHSLQLTVGNTLSSTHPTPRRPVSSLRPSMRRHATVTAVFPLPVSKSSLGPVHIPNETTQQNTQLLNIQKLSAVQECPDEVEYSGGPPLDKQHNQALHHKSHTWPDNLTPMGLLEGLDETSKSHCNDSMSITFCMDQQPEGNTADPGFGRKVSSSAAHFSRPLSQRSVLRKQGYMLQKPTDSHKEIGVEFVEWYTKEGVRQDRLDASNHASWLPPISGDTPHAHCLCAANQCHHSTTCQAAKLSSSYPFSIWSQSNSFIEFLNKSTAHVTVMPFLGDNEVHMQAGSRVFSRLSYRISQSSSQKLPSTEDMMVIGHRV